ncbi:Mni1p protein [Hirsutella rhossiliensis]|uniref:protein-histidine N-methyltransferase n=1 Tax=Hirsutella rhossiliensis TaxID=111463 RepID=A0A9P8MSK2_9HYPO|nr:Mni1p protein [Hirsutella rhossiliensis]KAH0960647.1 Mni1p protein [Hirsutella rhossiliensis]
MAFAFGFSGDDIDAIPPSSTNPTLDAPAPAPSGAFPVAGRPLLPPTRHDLPLLLSRLPSKMAYGCLDVALDDGATACIPRRELWDVRVQLMAEDESHGGGGEALGEHDVKTGVYEGGFKSWESSVDLVKVLAAAGHASSSGRDRPLRVIELGCGTALPSIALFQWALAQEPSPTQPLAFILTDYNPSVIQLVTLPNFLLAWALHCRHRHPALRDAFTLEDELELNPEVLQAFQTHLSEQNITLSFLSGAWSPELVQLLYATRSADPDASAPSPVTLVLGAETIYSPLALQAFTETVFAVLTRERADLGANAEALVAAKKLYFGVGGSLDDFTYNAQAKGGHITQLREETEGVRRGVVRCVIPSPNQNLIIPAVDR